jgi:hypothetical protein
MKRTSLKVALVASSLVAVLFAGMALGRNGRTAVEQKGAEVDLKFHSPQISWEAETKYVMKWDERCKRLLFDGRLASPKVIKPRFRHPSCNIVGVSLEPPSTPDEYSFDAGTVGKLVDLAESAKHDGRLQYHIQWDDSKEWFVGCETAPEPDKRELFMFTSGLGYR